MNAKPARKLRRDVEIGQELPRAIRTLRQIATTSQIAQHAFIPDNENEEVS